MYSVASLKTAGAGCQRRVMAIDRGWKASILGIGLLALALLH
jgi:hypothetical protein